MGQGASEKEVRPPDYEVAQVAFSQYQKPCVYAWQRDAEYLYIGTSRLGFSRPLANHHVIGIYEATQPEDKFLVWTFETAKDAALFEAEMIQRYLPLYNRATRKVLPIVKHVNREVIEFPEQTCPYCESTFIPTSAHQQYCCADHRKRAWFDRTYERASQEGVV